MFHNMLATDVLPVPQNQQSGESAIEHLHEDARRHALEHRRHEAQRRGQLLCISVAALCIAFLCTDAAGLQPQKQTAN